MSVNELAEKWRELFNDFSVPKMEAKERDDEYMSGRITGRSDMLDECAFDLDEIARTAWNPVSEPPTEADADDHGLVAWQDCYGRVETSNWWLVRDEPDLFLGCQWARTRDVILMPPTGR